MGLDMYLYRREYVGGWDWSSALERQDERKMYDTILEYTGAKRCADAPFANIEICVGYWRKANAIHGWFVNKLANGVDECQSIYVTKEDLLNLREACESVLRVPANVGGRLEDTASEVGLNPTRGFFFGSYDMDEWYMRDLEHTVEMIDSVLEDVPDAGWVDFVYRASW